MKRVYRRQRNTPILTAVGYAGTLDEAKRVAEEDATKRDRWAVYEFEQAVGNAVLTVRQVNGEYHVLLVDDPANRPNPEKIEAIMSRFDD